MRRRTRDVKSSTDQRVNRLSCPLVHELYRLSKLLPRSGTICDVDHSSCTAAVGDALYCDWKCVHQFPACPLYFFFGISFSYCSTMTRGSCFAGNRFRLAVPSCISFFVFVVGVLETQLPSNIGDIRMTSVVSVRPDPFVCGAERIHGYWIRTRRGH